MNKDELAKWMQLDQPKGRTFDTALPQQWLDEYVDNILGSMGYWPRDGELPATHLQAFSMSDAQYGEFRLSVYDAVLSGTVWAYDSSGAGFPVAVTPIAYALAIMMEMRGGKNLRYPRPPESEADPGEELNEPEAAGALRSIGFMMTATPEENRS